jgi:hypothetical protein
MKEAETSAIAALEDTQRRLRSQRSTLAVLSSAYI